MPPARVIFVTEDARAGKDFLKTCVHRFRPGVAVWTSRGVDRLGVVAEYARALDREAKVVVLADGDRLGQAGRRERLQEALARIAGLGIVIGHNVERLVARCIGSQHVPEYLTALRRRGKEAAVRRVLQEGLIEWARVEGQPEFKDVLPSARLR